MKNSLFSLIMKYNFTPSVEIQQCFTTGFLKLLKRCLFVSACPFMRVKASLQCIAWYENANGLIYSLYLLNDLKVVSI